ncbi:MAG: glycine zipper 2TM domain-containing protein [Gammaproteobacteria bacterium]
MNKSLIFGVAAGAVIATAGGAVAGYKYVNKPEYARVVSAKPVEKTIRTARQECHDEAVTQEAPVKDRKQVAGTAIGAVVGAVVGHQIGGGNGQKIATAAGAAAGGYAGNRVQKRMQDGRTVTTTEQRCETVYDTHIERRGYDVRYRIGDQEGKVRMDHDPGDRIPLRQGRLVLDANTGQG